MHPEPHAQHPEPHAQHPEPHAQRPAPRPELHSHGPDDVPQFFGTRFQDVMWGKNAVSDVRLAPYDVVFVPRSGVAEVYKFFNQYLLQFVPVSWGFSYVVNNNAASSVVPVQ